MKAESTCGLAGLLLRLMIFLTRFPSALVVIIVCSDVMGTRSVDVVGARDGSSVRSIGAVVVVGGGDCTSAMMGRSGDCKRL